MLTRILSGLALVAIVLAVLYWLPPWGTLLVALLAMALGVREFAILAEVDHEPLPRVLMAVAAGVSLVAVAIPWLPVELSILAGLIAIGSAAVAEAQAGRDVIRRVGAALLPVAYLALPLGAMVAVRRDRGATALLVLIATTVVSDTMQYFGGRLLGRHKLSPIVSPKKTVEGAVCGVVFGGLVLPIAGLSLFPAVPFWALWTVGLALTALGITGDLFESLLKRSVKVKDSSELIPGHGGVLDRIDSLLFAAPFYYGFLQAIPR